MKVCSSSAIVLHQQRQQQQTAPCLTLEGLQQQRNCFTSAASAAANSLPYAFG
jgi:hypothetical protein